MIRVERRRLDNGLRIAVAPIAELRSVSVILAIEAGQWFEPIGRNGIARLAAQTTLRGTTRRSGPAWADAIDALGAVARLDVGAHWAAFTSQSLTDDLDALVDLIAEVIRMPALAPEDLDFVRQQTLAQFERDERDTRAVVDRLWRELVYPKTHPFHAPPIGDASVVREATVDEVREYHEGAIRPDGAVLVVAGSVTADRVEAAAARAFGDWRAPAIAPVRDVQDVALSATARRT
ncbi:MAG: pitrilysin family protein, partial [Chloroflexota bacterium]